MRSRGFRNNWFHFYITAVTIICGFCTLYKLQGTIKNILDVALSWTCAIVGVATKKSNAQVSYYDLASIIQGLVITAPIVFITLVLPQRSLLGPSYS